MYTDWSSWVGAVIGLVRLGLLWMCIRWLWLNYKASKIIIELADILREQAEESAEVHQESAPTSIEGQEEGDTSPSLDRYKPGNII